MNEIIPQNILIVDDRPENLIVLENILESPSINLIKANSGEEALRLLLKVNVALILLDVQMPEMDGFETATFIRGAPHTKHIPIIFVTAISKEQKHIFKGYETGAVDYMFKPLDPDILKSKVKVFLELDQQKKILELRNRELQEAKKNTDNILENVRDGFFLLDSKLNFKPQYSLALEKILVQKKLGHVNFIQFLDKKIPDKIKFACRDYLELMFRDDVHEKTLDELNPLAMTEVNFKNDTNKPANLKTLSFNFKRVCNNDQKINEIIATVTDITDKVGMAKKLEESEAHAKKQMELMFNILHVEPPLLKEFMEGVQLELKNIDNLLKHNENASEYSSILENIFRSIHLVKGNASLLDLKFFVNQAHKFEENIINIRNKIKIEGTDFVSLVLQLAELQNTIFEINNLIERIKNIHTHFRPKQSYENKLFMQSLSNFVNNIAFDLNKKVKLEYKDFNLGYIPYQYRLLSKGVLIQLLRNAIYHGIEESKERQSLKKNLTGSITLSSFEDNSNFGFRLRDDGKGLQIAKLREIAISSGKWKQSEINKWDEKQVATVIFLQGISTSKETNLVAGRGVGMNSVQDRIAKVDGKIEVDFKENKFCEFTITIPKPKKR
jgi:response regulator RpfG family c-di-GMP phosphodiesterase